jgi:hypothetical protein
MSGERPKAITSSELIARLQELDPEGTMQIALRA